VEWEDLVRIQLCLEYNIDPRGDLRAFPWADPNDVPQFAVVRHSEGYLRLFHHDAPPRLRSKVGDLDPQEIVSFSPRASKVLAALRRAPRRTDQLYFFPTSPRTDEAKVQRHGEHFVIQDAERLVAWAWTVREHAIAAEGSVETSFSYQGPSFGQSVLGAWVRHVQRKGKLAFVRSSYEATAIGYTAKSIGGELYATSTLFF
jgi:hypothetical protein